MLMAAKGIEHGTRIAKANGIFCYELLCLRYEPVVHCIPGFALHSSLTIPQLCKRLNWNRNSIPKEKQVEAQDGTFRLLMSKNINLDHWLKNNELPEYRHMCLLVDEASNLFDQYDNATQLVKIIFRILNVVRHRSFVMIGTSQDYAQLPNNIRFHIQFLVHCKDLRHTRWGKKSNLQKGQVIKLDPYDCRGYITGREWTRLQNYTMFGPRVWNYYNTASNYNVFENDVKYIKKKREVIIDLNKKYEPYPEDARNPDYHIAMAQMEDWDKKQAILDSALSNIASYSNDPDIPLSVLEKAQKEVMAIGAPLEMEQIKREIKAKKKRGK